jgi:ABC-type sugar transport system permease subunit
MSAALEPIGAADSVEPNEGMEGSELAGARRVQMISSRKERPESRAFRSARPYLYVLPFFVSFILFSLYPTLYGLSISLYDWDGVHDKVFIGLGNYINALTNPYFYKPLLTSFLIMITTPITTAFGLIIAVMLGNRMTKMSNVFKTIYFLPYITMPVVIALLFKLILADNGMLNALLSDVGLIEKPIRFLTEKGLVLFNLNLVVLWKYFGYHMVIYLGGYQSIDHVLYEAAQIDGANRRQVFFRIIVPLMIPYIVFMTLTIITGSLSLFDEPMMLYGASGGPEGSAQTMGMYIYFNIFGGNARWGYATAVSGIVFVIVAAMSIGLYRVKKFVER